MDFSSYAAELRAALASAKRALETEPSVSAAEKLLDDAKELLNLVELDAPSAAAKTQLKPLRAELASLRAAARAKRSAAAAAASGDCMREELFAGSSSAAGAAGDDDHAGERTRMLETNKRLARGTDKLLAAHASTIDMEERGASIMDTLAQQRETLLRSRSTLSLTGAKLDESRRVLASMAQRAAANKLALRVAVLILLGVVMWISWPGTQ